MVLYSSAGLLLLVPCYDAFSLIPGPNHPTLVVAKVAYRVPPQQMPGGQPPSAAFNALFGSFSDIISACSAAGKPNCPSRMLRTVLRATVQSGLSPL